MEKFPSPGIELSMRVHRFLNRYALLNAYRKFGSMMIIRFDTPRASLVAEITDGSRMDTIFERKGIFIASE